MALLTSGTERYALKQGSNTLGGRGADAVALGALAGLPASALITVRPDAAPVVQSLAPAIVVRVDGERIGTSPRRLRHGARIEVGTCELVFDEQSAAPDGRAAQAAGMQTEVAPAVSAPAGGRLVELATGRALEIPERGLVIGRASTCDVVLAGKGVSRRHAVVTAGPHGYTVVDESANGTYVNGTRVAAAQLLAPGDTLRVGVEEFRFELAAAPKATASGAATELVGAARTAPTGGAASPARPSRAGGAKLAAGAGGEAPPLALLEVTRGPLAGAAFRVDRPVCSIGRAEHNDVRLSDESVSGAHATLLFKAGAWYVVDLRSANGTFVDGYRVAGERVVSAGCTLSAGNVKMTFRPLTRAVAGTQGTQGTRRVVGLLSRLSKLLEGAS
jgi:pSer/pThr/pTyr-binding forkhead associated (FHA) protein